MLGRGHTLAIACIGILALHAKVRAQSGTYPLWATTPGAASSDSQARMQFEAALRKRALGPLETVAIPEPQPSQTARRLNEASAAMDALDYAKAAAVLDTAVTEVMRGKGADLSADQLPLLFFLQGMAIQAASGTTYSEPFTTITPPAARQAYLRAAVLHPLASAIRGNLPPIVEASWRIALGLVLERPRATLTVHAPQRAMISIDGKAALPPPISATDLAYGEHFVSMEETGHVPWTTTIALTEPKVDLEAPSTAFLAYDTSAAAATARAKGASFALLGQLHLAGDLEIDLRLVDAKTAQVRDATAVPLLGENAEADLATAVLRLDESASKSAFFPGMEDSNGPGDPRIRLVSPPARPQSLNAPTLRNDTGDWLRLHWPLLTAIGVAAGTAIVLGSVVAADHSPSH